MKKVPWNKGKKTGPNAKLSASLRAVHAKKRADEVLQNEIAEAMKAFEVSIAKARRRYFSVVNERSVLTRVGWLVNDSPIP